MRWANKRHKGRLALVLPPDGIGGPLVLGAALTGLGLAIFGNTPFSVWGVVRGVLLMGAAGIAASLLLAEVVWRARERVYRELVARARQHLAIDGRDAGE